jgi:hypothetical protein
VDNGSPAREVGLRAVAGLTDRLVVSDAHIADQRWLDRLADGAGQRRITTVGHYYAALEIAYYPLVEKLPPRPSAERGRAEAFLRETAAHLISQGNSEEDARTRVRHRALDDASSLSRRWLAVKITAEEAARSPHPVKLA